ncbi:MAG: septation regulator SpoVG [Firmicutes bacterium]|nr:septation regulator SpoVG [Bacillota bacterium]
MEITDIRVRKISTEGKMKAVVSVTFDNAFVVHDIKVIESQDKMFVAMPSRKTPDGEFKDIAHPINAETRDIIQGAILEKFETTLIQEGERTEENMVVE